MANLQSLTINQEADLNGQHLVSIQWDDGLEFEYNECFCNVEQATPEAREDYVMGKLDTIRKNVEEAEARKALLPTPPTPQPQLTEEEKIDLLAKEKIKMEILQQQQQQKQALIDAKVAELKSQGWTPE